jgi:hypothetical protein
MELSLSLDKSLCCLLLLLPYMGLFCLYSSQPVNTHTGRKSSAAASKLRINPRTRILTNAEIIITWGKLERPPGRVPNQYGWILEIKHFRQCVSSYRRACRGYLLQKRIQRKKQRICTNPQDRDLNTKANFEGVRYVGCPSLPLVPSTHFNLGSPPLSHATPHVYRRKTECGTKKNSLLR